MLQGRVGLFLCIGMEVVENAAARVGVVHHPVECGDNHAQVHMAVVRQELTDLAQWHGLVIDSPIPRQYPLAEATEGGVVQHITQAILRAQRGMPGRDTPFLRGMHCGLGC